MQTPEHKLSGVVGRRVAKPLLDNAIADFVRDHGYLIYVVSPCIGGGVFFDKLSGFSHPKVFQDFAATLTKENVLFETGLDRDQLKEKVL